MRGNSLFKKIDRWIGIPLVCALGSFVQLRHFFIPSTDKKLQLGDRVLVVKLSALGDTLILLPIFKALKEKIGNQGRLMMMATSVNQAALEGFPYVDEVLLLDFGRMARNPSVLLNFLKRLWRFRAQIALDFDQWLRISPLLCFFSGAPQRYGFKTNCQHRHFLYHQTILNGKEEHEFEQFTHIAGLAGVQRREIRNFNGFLEQENLFKDSSFTFSTHEKKIVHMHPGCGSYGWQRAWPPEYYVQLIQKLSGKADVAFRITGMGDYEKNLVKKIIRDSGLEIDDRSGRLEITQLAGLLREADLVICGNTGIMHLASGLGRPLVVMNGPANPIKWGPLLPVPDTFGPQENHSGVVRLLTSPIHCSPCTTLGFEYGCQFRPCMESIQVGKVLGECLSLLNPTQTESTRKEFRR
jgi:ADP-heptose:LPS heptosyltransferase